jgi:hypothetical protein
MKILPVLVASGVAALAGTSLVAGLTFEARNANATMQFTQQTGKPCAYCHTVPPALNDAGKGFKAKGNKL